jgi:hypothetical protein
MSKRFGIQDGIPGIKSRGEGCRIVMPLWLATITPVLWRNFTGSGETWCRRFYKPMQ